MDADGAFSLLTFLNLYLQGGRPLEGSETSSFTDLLSNLAERLVGYYNKKREELKRQNYPLADEIIDARVGLVDRLVDLSNIRLLSDSYDIYINHLDYHLQHEYEGYYYVDNNQNGHFSSQYVAVKPTLDLEENC